MLQIPILLYINFARIKTKQQRSNAKY